ncbi:MAG: hypothetical protein QM737_05220 [Ferruginibacter sp.]
MKKIITSFVVLLLIIFTCDRVIGYVISEVILPKTISGESIGAVNYLLKKKKNIDFLVMGSSRARYQVNPALMKDIYNANGYNAGNSGVGGTIYNNLLLHLLIDKGIVPKLLIFQADPYPYFTTNDENINPEISSMYPFMTESERLKKLIESRISYSEKAKLQLHIYRYNGKVLRIINHYLQCNNVKDNYGFEGSVGKIDTTVFAAKTNVNDEHHFSKIKMQAMKDIIQTCKENNIRLVVLFPPTFRNTWFSKACNDSIVHFLNNENIHDIYDFSDIRKIPSLQSNVFWKNATHLNNEGAAIFSLLLNDSLKHIH